MSEAHFAAYGAMLVVAWNACVWTFVLTELTTRALPDGAASLWQTLSFSLLVLGAVLPHLLLEASAYVIASLAGIFVSKALVKYGPRDPAMAEIVQVAAVMVLLAATILVAAGLIESTWPSLVLSAAWATNPTLDETSLAPAAASSTLRAISPVAARCCSTDVATLLEISETVLMVWVIVLIADTAISVADWISRICFSISSVARPV